VIELIYNGKASVRIGDEEIGQGATVTVAEADAKALCDRYGFKCKDASKRATKKKRQEG